MFRRSIVLLLLSMSVMNLVAIVIRSQALSICVT